MRAKLQYRQFPSIENNRGKIGAIDGNNDAYCLTVDRNCLHFHKIKFDEDE